MIIIGYLYKKWKDENNKLLSEKIDIIAHGNISIFIDNLQNIYIIPYVKDDNGIGKAIKDSPIILITPYDHEKLGKVIRSALKLCKNSTPSNDRELMSKLGTNDWKNFSSDKRSLSIHIQDNKIIVNSTKRDIDGTYYLNKYPGSCASLSNDAYDAEIGQTIIQVLRYCRV